jgi:hypothetical protein
MFEQRAGVADRHTPQSLYENTLTPSTLAWLRTLPSAVCPRKTAAWSARLANRLSRHWNTYLLVEPIFQEVLVQQRATTPPDVQAEMRTLYEYFRAQHVAPRRENWDDKRRAPSPYDQTLNAAASKWLETLPETVRPLELSRRFPRIVNKLSRYWDSPAMIAECFDDLLVDKRGGRKGFPPEVQVDLRRLFTYWQTQRRSSASADVWSLEPGSEGKLKF